MTFFFSSVLRISALLAPWQSYWGYTLALCCCNLQSPIFLMCLCIPFRLQLHQCNGSLSWFYCNLQSFFSFTCGEILAITMIGHKSLVAKAGICCFRQTLCYLIIWSCTWFFVCLGLTKTYCLTSRRVKMRLLCSRCWILHFMGTVNLLVAHFFK